MIDKETGIIQNFEKEFNNMNTEHIQNFLRYLYKNNLDLNDVVGIIENNKNKENDKECCEACSMTPEQANKIKIHKDICDKIHTLYETKNMDYGDSMHPLFEEFGLQAFLVMFHIKINRIKSLQYREANYESMEDSLMDLANYALIALTELKQSKEDKK